MSDHSSLFNTIGDLVGPFNLSVQLRITYNHRLVINGCDLRPSATVTRPMVEVGGEDFSTFYTLIMVDLDAPNPSNPTLREYLHWIVTDIPGTTNVRFGRELISYESPRPVIGIHRIVFMLFRQLGRNTVFEPALRHNFSTRNFAQEYNLTTFSLAYFNCQREAGSGGRRFQN
ncbi:protein RICE FLOWERING LOCUS T 1-like [Phalaenopsis equestris]|uniref:protein RICE FLOWERING LOCUS T 1-like n=1 Tax=Phalaenopsis equestris TaxID=78828 RepID=UPI0009E382EE|nr:protein RICE FLOWERING LOCUS T 1-like [Phalaenopsis equestris]